MIELQVTKRKDIISKKILIEERSEIKNTLDFYNTKQRSEEKNPDT
jgi:hypothetical protein